MDKDYGRLEIRLADLLKEKGFKQIQTVTQSRNELETDR